MKSFSAWLVGLVASPVGIVVLAALDSTIFFSMPYGIDAAVVIFAASHHTWSWIVAVLATAGSIGGAAVTFWMGVKIGEHGLHHFISPKRLTRIRRKARGMSAIGLAALDLIPPPFPFTPFILAAGALEVDVTTFFGTLAACRIFRFGAEAAIAVFYGPKILTWLDSRAFHNLVIAFSALAVALTALSVMKLVAWSRTPPRG